MARYRTHYILRRDRAIVHDFMKDFFESDYICESLGKFLKIGDKSFNYILEHWVHAGMAMALDGDKRFSFWAIENKIESLGDKRVDIVLRPDKRMYGDEIFIELKVRMFTGGKNNKIYRDMVRDVNKYSVNRKRVALGLDQVSTVMCVCLHVTNENNDMEFNMAEEYDFKYDFYSYPIKETGLSFSIMNKR